MERYMIYSDFDLGLTVHTEFEPLEKTCEDQEFEGTKVKETITNLEIKYKCEHTGLIKHLYLDSYMLGKFIEFHDKISKREPKIIKT